jgi:hypothetical protein
MNKIVQVSATAVALIFGVLLFALSSMAQQSGQTDVKLKPKTQTSSKANDAVPQLMFVQTAEDLNVDAAAKTFRLVNVNQQTLFFSDRPVRIAGHYKMADYLKVWSEGKDNFGEDPPNATLSIYEPGQTDNTLVVVEINNPLIDGADLIYSYKLIEGTMPAGGGATALFIDWVPARPGAGGAGSGVGFGAGAGAGGPGVGGPRGVGW